MTPETKQPDETARPALAGPAGSADPRPFAERYGAKCIICGKFKPLNELEWNGERQKLSCRAKCSPNAKGQP